MIGKISRSALLGFLLAILGTLAAGALTPAQAAIPGGSSGFDHFVDCAWLMISNSGAHHLQCGPSQVELAPGFPGTGVVLTTPGVPSQPAAAPAAPSCCPCANGGASIDVEMSVLLAAADDTLWTGPSDPLQEFLLACCPCGS